METPKVPYPSGLEGLQSSQQRALLDAVDELRNCGIENDLSLPQLVVCGDQSAGKSSVLEALTEINFPRADNLCTRFATEIILRRSRVEKLSVKIIPDAMRTPQEQQKIQAFKSSTSNFFEIASQLADIIDEAKVVMGIDGSSNHAAARSFAKDVLSIQIEGPNRPQLTVVDLPGLIQNENQAGDKELVDDLTKQYITQPRAICLAVITAMNDADNQRILTLVKEVDPHGKRSIGIITKPDTLPPGSGNEKSFIDLALNRNAKYFFKLGWHVLKNRKFEESQVTFETRNQLEQNFFRESNFKTIPKTSVGIDSLRIKLSNILYDHVRRELPGIRVDVERMLDSTRRQLQNLGMDRTSKEDCREYLIQVSETLKDICRCALSGNYESTYFQADDFCFDKSSDTAVRRLRAMIQKTNEDFAQKMRKTAHTFHFKPEGVKDNSVYKPETSELESERVQIDSRPRSFSDVNDPRAPWVKQKVFIDVVITLVTEEHIFHDVENVFSPKMVNRMTDEELEFLASEPDDAKRERVHFQDQLEKLQIGQKILKKAISQ
ncbi:hypothetical protein MBLNU459_g5290t1 [Dothideomycetes sp. NU459]